ncbi:MAG: stalk domain-containing protein [Eubacteriales bacterium]|uniref:glucosaminidase domain-containing protein n=1 Tax=Fenollaria sp. TaxID=1965292 RepID=UPI002A75D54C|nr:glucosaminidase domain-containing protein [Fenollaria sp.]MDD7339402.1 stalk domain-containing protein [Eubacteriales bacterium]MDY3106033.1 stalk domain-containing protein [Fenollaria sp.]
MKKLIRNLFILSILLLGLMNAGTKAASLNLIIDGNNVTKSASPIVKNRRTLVPLRFIGEALGKEVLWNNDEKSVTVSDDSASFKLYIDSKIIDNSDGTLKFTDVAPCIVNRKTYLPLRAIAELMNIGVGYDKASSTVTIDSSTYNPVEENTTIVGLMPNQTINTKMNFTFVTNKNFAKAKLFLLNDKNEGYIQDVKTSTAEALEFLPSLKDEGNKKLVLALYDANGNVIEATGAKINLNVLPRVTYSGVDNGGFVQDELKITPDINFIASKMKAIITNLTTGKTETKDNLDPEGEFLFKPSYLDAGSYSIMLSAFDELGREHFGETKTFTMSINPYLNITGVPKDGIISGQVTLNAQRNFDVMRTDYVLRDPVTAIETVIESKSYGACKFFPNINDAGQKEVFVRCIDASGKTMESEHKLVLIKGDSKLILEGVAPGGIVHKYVDLNAVSNVGVNSVNYYIKNLRTGKTKTIAENVPYGQKFRYNVTKDDEGENEISVTGNQIDAFIKGESIKFRIYTGKIYTKQPLMAKDKFLDYTKKIARREFLRTDLSGAITTAQAILESGWGQSVPVDKYTGKFSNNLFGIKGSASNGTVTITTTEVYNNVRYTVDDKFRAYKSADESFRDHTELFFAKKWYTPFRKVMFNDQRGVYAIKRCGYATDPSYPAKLKQIIDKYNLKELDKVNL